MNPPTLQSLPRTWARFCLEIESFVANDLHTDIKGTTLLVAYSTGLDSTALLHIFHSISTHMGIRLAAAHLNHMLRPEAVREQDIARTACAEMDIPFFGESADVHAFAREHKTGIEESARILRYAFLEKARIQAGADYILTAHHGDDLAEDVLMRLIRGTGWPALSGMPGVDLDRRIIRPLLGTSKKKLRGFLHAMDISWEEDRSNTDMNFLRNRVRSEILPLFCKENPGFAGAIKQLWRMGQTDQSYWQKKVVHYLPEKQPALLPDSLRTLDQALRQRIIKHMLETMGPGQPLAASIFKLDTLWQNKATGKTIQFPGDKRATITRDGITFESIRRENGKKG